LLQSFFELNRRAGEVFFDTRIVRVTECLMFLERLYKGLGAPTDAKLGVRIIHRGLKGKKLTVGSVNRIFFRQGASVEDVSSSEITTNLGTMSDTRVDDVRKILEPMFLLFDFAQISNKVYAEIVRGFENGRVL